MKEKSKEWLEMEAQKPLVPGPDARYVPETWDWAKGFEAAAIFRVRDSLKARLEGRNEGGDIEVMRLVDEIVKHENRLCSLCGQGSSCKCA